MDNLEFDLLPVEQKRVRLAQEAINQLVAKRFVASPSVYFNVEDKRWLKWFPLEGQLNEAVKADRIVCECCVKGGLFLAHVMFKNDFTILDAKQTRAGGVSSDMIEQRLSDIFSQHQLNLIETAFEGEMIWNDLLIGEEVSAIDRDDSVIYTELGARAISFYNQYSEYDDDRFLAIMLNIIENKGEFVP